MENRRRTSNPERKAIRERISRRRRSLPTKDQKSELSYTIPEWDAPPRASSVRHKNIIIQKMEESMAAPSKPLPMKTTHIFSKSGPLNSLERKEVMQVASKPLKSIKKMDDSIAASAKPLRGIKKMAESMELSAKLSKIKDAEPKRTLQIKVPRKDTSSEQTPDLFLQPSPTWIGQEETLLSTTNLPEVFPSSPGKGVKKPQGANSTASTPLGDPSSEDLRASTLTQQPPALSKVCRYYF